MRKQTSLLLGFLILKFVLQYTLIDPVYDLQRDEYLHLDQANHPAWGYLSVPPVTSWISSLIRMLGNTVFWIKFFPALFGALTLLVVWKAIAELRGSTFALILGAVCVLLSALLRLNTLYQPNSLDVLCWTLLYYILIRYILSERPKWLYLGAVVFAFGFLNKYNIVFLILGLFPAILLTSHRKLLTRKEFYLAILLGTLLVLPNLLWQYHNGFPVIHHMKELADTQLVHVDRFAFLKSQLLFFTGGLFVIIAGLCALLVHEAFRPFRLFILSFLFTLLVFLYFRAKDYYAIGLYPIYLAFGSVYLGRLLHAGWQRYLQPLALAVPILLFIPLFRVAFPNKTPEEIIRNPEMYRELGMLRWEDGKDHHLPQDFADMLGWKELAAKVDSVCSTLPDLSHTLVLCDNYGQAGAINYYKSNPHYRAASFNADYVNWLWYDRPIRDVVLVKDGNDAEDRDRSEEIPLFDSVYLAAERINLLAREDSISIYVLRGARIDVNKRIREEADKKKNSP